MYSIMHVTVSDFDTWKAAFDSMEPVRQSHGVKSNQVMRGIDNPNEIVIILEWGNEQSARDYFASDELKAAMKKGGLLGKSDVWFTNKI